MDTKRENGHWEQFGAKCLVDVRRLKSVWPNWLKIRNRQQQLLVVLCYYKLCSNSKVWQVKKWVWNKYLGGISSAEITEVKQSSLKIDTWHVSLYKGFYCVKFMRLDFGWVSFTLAGYMCCLYLIWMNTYKYICLLPFGGVVKCSPCIFLKGNALMV